MKQIVAIVGRPNVGKSRLFNRITGRNLAIVGDMPGITRDRHYAPADWCGREFLLVDTGGIELDPHLDLERDVSQQSLRAISEADAVIVVFDGHMPPSAHDQELISQLRTLKRPVYYAINKIDRDSHEPNVAEYQRYGLDVFPVSAEHGRGVDALLEALISGFPPEAPVEEPEGMRVAVIGRPNVGKSTLVNRLCGEDRVVVSDMPGTTRDAIDVALIHEDQRFVFVDTAGVARGHRVAEQITKVTALRTLRAIERAQVVVQLIDASEGLAKQDLTLMGYVHEQGRGLVLLVNKSDLLKQPWEEFHEILLHELGELHDVPLLRISAKTGMNCAKIFSAISRVYQQLNANIPTAKFNKSLEEWLSQHHLPAYRGKPIRIFYGTQVNSNPPTFMLFTNQPTGIPTAYRRYLARRIQEEWNLKGIPVRLVFRQKNEG